MSKLKVPLRWLVVLGVALLGSTGAHATTFLAWGAECTAPCTNTATGTLAPPGVASDNFALRSSGNTSISSTVSHSGTRSLRTVAIGNDGGNQPEGALQLYQGDTYGTFFPGTFAGSTRYYRWWMRIESGWSWGDSGIGDPVFKIIRESNAGGQWFTVLMSPSGFQFDDCDFDAGTSHAGECFSNTGESHASQINVSYSHPTDGVWREYILKIKQPSSFACTPGAGCDSEFSLYINGTQVSTNTGWKIVPDSGVANNAGFHFPGVVAPYFQIRSSVAAGGTIYWDDMSIDDTFNSIAGGGDTTPPTGVAITAPSNGATVSGSSTTVTATCTDETAVQDVQMLLDGSNLGSPDTSSPYSITWNTTGTGNGSHTLSARCTDTSSNQTTSSTISVTVSNGDTTPPVVSITSPSASALLRGSVSVTANCTDNVAPASVQFKLDGSNLGALDTSSPFSISWDTTAASNAGHTLTAVCADAAANSTTSSGVAVTVDNAAPSVSITAPAAGTVSGIQTVSASCMDNLAVESVQFKRDGVNLGSADSTSPYTMMWNTASVINGGHTVGATCTDTAGNSTAAIDVALTVSNAAGTIPASVARCLRVARTPWQRRACR